MTKNYKKVIGFAITLSVFILVGSFAAPANAAVCNDTNGFITSVGGNGSPATASATNNSFGCSMQITFSSYKMFVQTGEPGWLDTQVLFDSQTLSLAPGETKTFTINTPVCKTQLDIYEGPAQPHLTDASGTGGKLFGWNINTDNLCTNNPPPATLICSPSSQSGNVNDVLNFSATGGNGNYSWTSPGSPSSGPGANFSSAFSASGTKTVTVTDGAQTAQCSATINQPPATLTCAPSNQTVNVGSIAVFSASGGSGNYAWTSPGFPGSGVGINFSSAFSSAGQKTVTVTSGAQTAQCNVNVNQPVQTLICSPSSQSGNVNDVLNFSATGGNGNYSWTSPGSPSSGSGANFSSAFSASGTKTVTVTDGAQTAQCNVNVNQVIPQLACAPSTQNGNVNDSLNFNASGGTGSYNWYVSDGNPSTGNNSTFTTQFSTSGNKTITVTNGTQSAQCTANINQPQQQQVYCNPQNQNVNVGDLANFNATGGSGNYYWSTSGDATPSSGNGSNFSARFSNNGTKIVTVNSSGAGSAQCTVTVNSQQQTLNFQITKNVLNRTLGQSVYVNNVEAQQQDMVEFEIRIQTNNYNNSYNNNYQIFLRDALPYGLSYVSGSTRVNGSQVPDGITQSVGVNLNNNYNQEQVIRFLATVDQGRTSGTFTNQASATINSDTRSASASVTVRPRGTVLGAADVVTGPEDAWPAALGLGFLAALLVYYFYFMKELAVKGSGLRIRVIDALPIVQKPKRKTELESILEKIKVGENGPDI